MPWYNVGRSDISMFSTAVQFFLGPLNLQRVSESLESFAEEIQTAMRVDSARGERDSFSLPGRLLSFVAVLNPFHYCVTHDSSVQFCLFLCSKNRGVFIVGFWHGFSSCADTLISAAILYKHSGVIGWQHPDVTNCIFHNNILF